jgi:cytochrome c biogenesis protein CcdA/thiol-disulfide isomerase/thioredoxin
VILLIGVAFLAGLIIGISPCIVPVLPVIVATGAMSADRRRPYWVIAGLVASFTLTFLFAAEILSLLHLPEDLLQDLGIGLLIALGIGLVIPKVGEWLERPFTKVRTSGPVRGGGGFVFGASLGLVFVPCTGPVLGAISTVGGDHRVGPTVFLMTIAYAIGASVPLFGLSELSRRAVGLFENVRSHLREVRIVSGVLMAASGIVIATGALDSLQSALPGYANSLQRSIEGSASVHSRLEAIEGRHGSKLGNAQPTVAANLMDYGNAPNFKGITAWLNTPGGKALSLSSLKGKVVLVDFWTYSCINCQRTLPHVEAWYNAYHRFGFDVVGVSTPEFAFEHVVPNVASAAKKLGVDYPIAVDDNYGTWNAYMNQYWPAEYLIDQQGVIRREEFGEGSYAGTETAIRALLEAGGATDLPPATEVANRTPTERELSPETYVGYSRLQDEDFIANPALEVDRATDYQAPQPSQVLLPDLAFGGTWTVNQEEATAGTGAELILAYEATDVYLVMGGSGTVGVSVDGHRMGTVDVSGVPGLYSLVGTSSEQSGTLELSFSPGVEAYDFTFG